MFEPLIVVLFWGLSLSGSGISFMLSLGKPLGNLPYFFALEHSMWLEFFVLTSSAGSPVSPSGLSAFLGSSSENFLQFLF